MKKIAKKWISCMITAAMVVGGLTLSPITTMEVQAAPAETRNVNLRLTDNSIAGISGDTVNTANAATVYYGKYPEVEGVEETLKGTSMPWRVIGYNGTGVASSSNSGKATLLAADRVINKVQFLAGGSSNQYSGSTLKDKIEIIAGGLATIEKEAVSARTLAICGYNQEDHVNGEGHDGYCDGITGSKVADAVMWPLSTREAQNLNASLWTITASAQRTFWWLRSPGTYEKCAAGVDSDGYVASPVDIGADEYYHGSARPAFNLKLSSVLFTSESGASKSDTFAATSDGSGISSWKLTLKGSGSINPTCQSGNTNLQTGYTNETLTIAHDPASSMTDATQVSAMLADSNGTVLYYGRISDDTSATSTDVTIPEGLSAGSYSLYVFAEDVNGVNETDYASALGDPITITVAQVTTVDSVSVSPATTSVQKGTTQLFSATVNGTGTPAQTVT